MAERGHPAVFQLLDATAPDVGADVLGLWMAPPEIPTEVTFDVMAAPTPEAAVWRVMLPADARLAAARLSDAEAMLGASQRAAAEAPDRLMAFARAYAAGATGSSRPEAELATLLGATQPSDETVFDVDEQPVGTWERVIQQFQVSMQRLVKAVAHYAWVETYTADKRLGWTVVGWTGDVATLWLDGLGPEQVVLHQRALDLALASRATLIRMFILAARGAITLSAAVAMPLGGILALPAAWKFINDVLAELRKHEAQP
jgi:hypothetical protein